MSFRSLCPSRSCLGVHGRKSGRPLTSRRGFSLVRNCQSACGVFRIDIGKLHDAVVTLRRHHQWRIECESPVGRIITGEAAGRTSERFPGGADESDADSTKIELRGLRKRAPRSCARYQLTPQESLPPVVQEMILAAAMKPPAASSPRAVDAAVGLTERIHVTGSLVDHFVRSGWWSSRPTRSRR